MAKKSTVPNMPLGKDSIQVRCTVKRERKSVLEEAAERAHLPNLSTWIHQAIEEKLQRDYPDLSKRH